MVAFSGYPCPPDDRGADRVFRRQRCRAVRLYPILTRPMKNTDTRKKDLETITVLAVASLACFFVFRRNAFVFAALGLLLLGLFFKSAASMVSAGWLRFSELLGGFNTRVILGLVYFTILTPIAVLFRLFTKKHVNSPRVFLEKTHFNIRDHVFTRSDLEKMW